MCIFSVFLVIIHLNVVYVKKYTFYKGSLFRVPNISNVLNFILMPTEFLSFFLKPLTQNFLNLPANYLVSKVAVGSSWGVFLITIVALSEKIIE